MNKREEIKKLEAWIRSNNEALQGCADREGRNSIRDVSSRMLKRIEELRRV